VVSDDRDEARSDELIRRLAQPLQGTAAARERSWSLLAERRRPRRRSALLPAFAVLSLTVLLLVAGGWLESYRIEVGHPGASSGDFGPLLYREEVARASFAGDVTGALFVKQRHIDEPRRGRLSVIVQADVDFASGPGAFEVRYRDAGSTITQVLVRRTTDAGDRTAEVVAPLPEHDQGDVRTYAVWLHIEAAVGAPIDVAIVTIEVSERPEGQRARLIGVR
jgi:hypothetical protein